MPIYEYEPDGFTCYICHGRFEVLQGVDEPALTTCPMCGLECRRVVSKPNFAISKALDYDKAGKKGFVTFRKSGEGEWERVAGEGAAGMRTGDKPAKKEPRPKKKFDLDDAT
jgi:putative FmdB family regulatory protein